MVWPVSIGLTTKCFDQISGFKNHLKLYASNILFLWRLTKCTKNGYDGFNTEIFLAGYLCKESGT
jgi:hypothetical protein